jgi:hypothetical protein
MARQDVVKERRRYKLIRRVLGGTFWIAFLFWAYSSFWVLFNPEARALMYAGSSFFEKVLTTLNWFFCVSTLPFCAVGAVKNYWFYIALFSGLSLWYYLRHLASFKCPYCRKVVDLNTTWECPSCHHVLVRPLWYTIFHKCIWSKCKEAPEGFQCPHCSKTIHLLSPAPQLRSLTPGESPPENQSNVARFPGTGS